MEFNKSVVYKLAVQAIEGVVEDAHGTVRYFEKEAAGYPSKMESASDTNRSQNQNMAEAARQTAKRMSEGLAELSVIPEGWDKEVHKTVQRYSLVGTVDTEGEELFVFIVPGKAGEIFDYWLEPDDEPIKIRALPEETPFAIALMGKSVGNTVLVVKRTLEIISLQ